MFCNKFKSKIKGLMKTITEAVLAKAELALQVTTGIRKILKSPVGDIVTAVIPGDLDNYIRQQLIAALDYAVISFEALNACKEQPSLEGKLKCVKAYLESKYPNEVEAILIKIAALMTKFLDGKKLPQNNYDTAAQVQFSLSK